MREVLWPLAAFLFGIGAARRARLVIADVHMRGTGFFYGTLNTRPGFPLVIALLNAAVVYGVTQRLTGLVATFAFMLFATNVLQQVSVDIDTHLLPRARSRGAAATGLFLLFLASSVRSEWSRWWWAILGAWLSWAVMRMFRFLSRGDLGGGDVTFAMMTGLHLGWLAIGNVPLALMLAFVLAGLQALVVLVVRRDRRHFFAFGPALGAGALLTLVFEASLRAYLGG